MSELKKVEIMDLAKIRMISDPQISPDNKRVVFVHTVMDFDKDEYLNGLWMVNLADDSVKQFTFGRSKDKNPRWSPDGSTILFTSTPPVKECEEKKTQLYVIGTHGGEARKITNVEGGVESPRWSPNGKNILFISGVKRKESKTLTTIVHRWRLQEVPIDGASHRSCFLD